MQFLLITPLQFWIEVFYCEWEITHCFCLRCEKTSLDNGLVEISTICSLDFIYSNQTCYSRTWSRRKWYFIRIRLVLECMTGFLEMLMALVLSQYMGIGWLKSTMTSSNDCFIHKTWVQHSVAAIYSTSAVDKETEDYFLLDQATKHSPKKNAFPLVIFLSSMLHAQSALVYAIRSIFLRLA